MVLFESLMKGSHQGIPWKSGGIRPDGETESREETRARNTSPTTLGCPGRAGSTDGTACGLLRPGRGASHSARLDPPIVSGTSSRRVTNSPVSRLPCREGLSKTRRLRRATTLQATRSLSNPSPSRSRAPRNSHSGCSILPERCALMSPSGFALRSTNRRRSERARRPPLASLAPHRFRRFGPARVGHARCRETRTPCSRHPGSPMEGSQ